MENGLNELNGNGGCNLREISANAYEDRRLWTIYRIAKLSLISKRQSDKMKQVTVWYSLTRPSHVDNSKCYLEEKVKRSSLWKFALTIVQRCIVEKSRKEIDYRIQTNIISEISLWYLQWSVWLMVRLKFCQFIISTISSISFRFNNIILLLCYYHLVGNRNVGNGLDDIHNLWCQGCPAHQKAIDVGAGCQFRGIFCIRRSSVLNANLFCCRCIYSFS